MRKMLGENVGSTGVVGVPGVAYPRARLRPAPAPDAQRHAGRKEQVKIERGRYMCAYSHAKANIEHVQKCQPETKSTHLSLLMHCSFWKNCHLSLQTPRVPRKAAWGGYREVSCAVVACSGSASLMIQLFPVPGPLRVKVV